MICLEYIRGKSNQIKSNQLYFRQRGPKKLQTNKKETVKKIDRETDIKTYKHTTH